MTGAKGLLESRLETFAKQATCEKLAKIKRKRFFVSSIGLSIVAFVTYSIVAPTIVSEESSYVKNDNQISKLSVLSNSPISVNKQKETPTPKETKVSKQTPVKEIAPILPQEKTKSFAPSKKTPPVQATKTKQGDTSSTVPIETYPVWSESQNYQVGDRVKYKEKIYQANEANSGNPPDQKSVLFGGPWDEVTD